MRFGTQTETNSRAQIAGARRCYQMRDRLFAPLLRALGAVGGRRILDVGCGDGTLSLALARAGASVVGIDLAPAIPPRAGRNPRVETADARQFRSRRRFDIAVMAFVVNELAPKDVPRVLANVAGHLSRGGRLVLLLPHPAFEDRERTKLIERRGIRRDDYLREGHRYEVSFRLGEGERVTRCERHYSLGFLVAALVGADFAICGLEEVRCGARRALPSYLLIDCVQRRRHGSAHLTASFR